MQIIVIRSHRTLLEAECGLCGTSYDTSARDNPIDEMIIHVVTEHKNELDKDEIRRLVEYIAKKA